MKKRSLHALIDRERGSAKEYSCVDCDHDANEWSWTHGTDPEDIANYKPRCYKCHRQYDFGKLSGADMDEIRKRYRPGVVSQEQLAQEFGVGKAVINRVLTAIRTLPTGNSGTF